MKKIALMLLLAVSVMSMAQEKVLLRLNYEKGDVFLVKMNMKQKMGEMMDMDITMDMKMNVKGVSNDIYDTEMNFTHVTMGMATQGTTMNYDSNDKEENMNAFAKGAHSKMKPVLETLISFKYDKLGDIKETKVISGSGSIESFKDNSNGIVYPEEAVTIGTSWKETKMTSQGVRMNYEYKVASIDKKKVYVDITGTISEVASGDFKGTALIDRETGNVSEMNVDMNMEVMGQKIKSEIKMTTIKG